MDDDAVLFSMNAIRSMEVIDINTGSKLGYVRDFKINMSEQRIIAIVIPPPVKSWFSKEANIEVPWEKVVKTGVDVILIDGSDIDLNIDENNS